MLLAATKNLPWKKKYNVLYRNDPHTNGKGNFSKINSQPVQKSNCHIEFIISFFG